MLGSLFSPAGVAIVGASDRPMSNGLLVMRYLLEHGYAGNVYPVNPRLTTLMGRSVWPSLAAVPGPPELAIVALGPDRLPAALREAADLGVEFAVLIGGLPSDPRALAAIRELVAGGGPRILGPGSVGIMNYHGRVMASMSSILQRPGLTAGPLAVLSQSGGLLGALLSIAADSGAGISKAVSLGEQFDLTAGEFLSFFADDPQTATVACIIEGLASPDPFLEGAERLRSAGKELAIMRVGRSAAGQISALAHSGAIAVPNRVFDGVFEQFGIVSADRLEDLIALSVPPGRRQVTERFVHPAAAPSHGDPHRVAKTGLAAISLSGGSCVAFADACAAAGAPLATLSEATIAAATGGAPTELSLNPIDVIPSTAGPDMTRDFLANALAAVDGDPASEVVVYVDSMLLVIDDVVDVLIAHHEQSQKPLLVAWLLGTWGNDAFGRLEAAKIPAFRTFEMCARYARRLLSSGAVDGTQAPPVDRSGAAAAAAELASYRSVATEAEMHEILVELGIPVTEGRFVRHPQEVGPAAEAVGFPVAVKLISPTVTHRAVAGALILGLGDAHTAEQAAADLEEKRDAGDPRQGFWIQPMVDFSGELFMAVHRDSVFGWLLLLGRGGVSVESEEGVVIRRLPIGESDLYAAVAAIKSEDVPAEAVADVARRLMALAEAAGDELSSVELNPLVVPTADPNAVIALDALATLVQPRADRLRRREPAGGRPPGPPGPRPRS
jgi:acyl-CoA synthetase (NDP forming)